MTRLSALLLGLLIVSCGSVGTPTPLGTASPAPTASPTPPPSPSPVVSAKGLITLKSPTVSAKLTSPVTITGDASVFEAALAWRISDTGGRVLAEGFTTASLGAPGRGTYSITAAYTVTTETVAFIEVFSRSPKDGNIDEIVRIPVTLH
jgi:hypothetical protein